MNYVKLLVVIGLVYHFISLLIFFSRVKSTPQINRPSHWLQSVTWIGVPGDFVVAILALLDIGRINIEEPIQTIINISGIAVYFFGMFLYSWASYSFTKKMPLNFMDIVVIKEHQLFESGAFNIVRHPIYASTGISILGICLALSNVIVLIWLLILIPLFYLRVKMEETVLIQHFGKKYEEYRQRVPMLVPFLKFQRGK